MRADRRSAMIFAPNRKLVVMSRTLDAPEINSGRFPIVCSAKNPSHNNRSDNAKRVGISIL